jgi:hypothetical protein
MLEVGEVWVEEWAKSGITTRGRKHARTMRRILGVHGGKVAYSYGGDHNAVCNLKTFRRWIKRMSAYCANVSASRNQVPRAADPEHRATVSDH